MGSSFSISITDVVRLLALEQDPKTRPGSPSYNVRCPFCDTPSDRRYHMNISEAKDAYRCVRCSGDEKNLGVLDLYSRVRFGCPASQKGAGYVFKALSEELHLDSNTIRRAAPVNSKPSYRVIKPASDTQLNEAYSALLGLPYVSLTSQHRLNLLRRGLGTIDIARNGYGSILLNERITKHPYYDTARKICNEKKNLIEQNPKLARQKKLALIAGIIIAHDLEECGIKLKRVPGFFRLDKVWCMKADEGMLIPTRNRLGQIVGIQTRTDAVYREGLRYITLSSKDLEEGPNTDISRIHFPLGNADLETAGIVGLTEGPLKADIAAALFRKPAFIMAVQGVNNTRELDSIISGFDSSIRTVWNMLDMDRFVNVHVQKASCAIEAKFRKRNMEFRSLVWDRTSLDSLYENIQKTCVSSDIVFPEMIPGREDEWIRQVFSSFEANKVSLESRYLECCGEDLKWHSDSKGIDDFLNRKKNKK